MLERLTVRARLILVVSGLISALVFIGCLGIYNASIAKDDLRIANEDLLQPMRHSGTLQRAKGDLVTHALLALQHDPKSEFLKLHDHDPKVHIEAIAKARENMEDALNKMRKKTPSSPEEAELLDKTAIATNELFLASDAVKRFLEDGQFFEANSAILKSLQPKANIFFEVFAELRNFYVRAAESNYAEAAGRSERARWLILLLGGGALLFAMTTGVLVIRSLTQQLGAEPHEAVAIFGKIAEGNLSVDVPFKNAAETSLIAAVSRMQGSLRALVSDTREIAQSISIASQSMAAASTQVEQSSCTQSEAASAVAAAVEQTSVSISEMAGNAKNADEKAGRARGDIENTLLAVRETADNVDVLANMIGEASRDITQLAESSRQIDGIVQSIKDIADQTNLLALNAAIEAARAGEQGRGFAVVADEVRKLAENTTKSTVEISGLITGIQAQVDAAVGHMQVANEKAGTTRAHVVASTKALDAASTDTGLVTDSVRSISDSVREQDIAVQEVARRMELIAQMTEENTAASSNAADTAKKLDALSVSLLELVGRFKV